MALRRRGLLAGGAALLAAPAALRAAPVLRDILTDAERLGRLRALAVMRAGELLALRSFGRVRTDDPLPLHSVTKSVVSMLVGAALRDGLLPGLQATVAARDTRWPGGASGCGPPTWRGWWR